MDISRDYMDSVSFEIVKQKYYNANKVNARLEEVKEVFTQLFDENEQLKAAVAEYDTSHDEIGDTLLTTQKLAAAMVADANESADSILARAKAEAELARSTAKDEALKVLNDAKENAAALLSAANEEAERLLAGANSEAEHIVNEAVDKANTIAPMPEVAEAAAALDEDKLQVVDRLIAQLEDLNVTHATQVFRIKQALMTMAMDNK